MRKQILFRSILFISSCLLLLSCAQKEIKRDDKSVEDPFIRERNDGIEDNGTSYQIPNDIDLAFTQRHVIGCILPLSGKYADFGERSLKGIQLAFSFFQEQHVKPFELAIYDSQGDSKKAAEGLEVLLKNHGIVALIGPLLTLPSQEVAKRAQQLQVPMIGLSQHGSITEFGDFIFRMAMTKKDQIDMIVDVACEQKGLRKFAILYPEDNYGIEFANLFWNKIETCGGTMEGIESYKPDQQDFNDEIKKLVGIYQPKARKEHYRLLEEQTKIELNREEVKESQVKLPPQVDFEALFIPDYAKTIGQIAPTLAYYDIDTVTLLGTQGWNSLELLERGEKHVEGALFVDGFFKESQEPIVQEFVRTFEKTYEESPGIWEAQAYDAAQLLLTLLENEEIQSRSELKEQLHQQSEFSGVTGEIIFGQNHDIQKKLFVLTVHQGKIRLQP